MRSVVPETAVPSHGSDCTDVDAQLEFGAAREGSDVQRVQGNWGRRMGFGTVSEGRVLLLVLAFVALFFYFLPTIIAASRKVVNSGSVLVINLLLGWTLVGWAVALAMAVRTQAVPYVAPAQPLASPGPPPGWYPDPHGSGGQRWWSGYGWTHHVLSEGTPSASPESG